MTSAPAMISTSMLASASTSLSSTTSLSSSDLLPATKLMRRLTECKSTPDLKLHIESEEPTSSVSISDLLHILNVMDKYQDQFRMFEDNSKRNSIDISILETIMEELLKLPQISNDARMTRLNNIFKFQEEHTNANIGTNTESLVDYRQNLFNWIYYYVVSNLSRVKDKQSVITYCNNLFLNSIV